MPRTAAGIPDRDDRGDHTRLRPGDLVDYVVQRHDAARAGVHKDIRLGTPDVGLISWATKKELPRPGGPAVALHRQPVHAHGYLGFEGRIRSGYGAGTVRAEDRGKALVTGVSPRKLEFSIAHRKHPGRLHLARPEGWGDAWLARNATPTPGRKPPYEKVHYRSIPSAQAGSFLSRLGPRDAVQPKIDGASLVLSIPKDRRIELFSYRNQARSGLPISHVEKVHGNSGDPRPRLDSLPGHLADSVLRGELYAEDRRGKVLPPQALGALLNATLENSLARQRERGVRLRAALFDVQRRGGKDVSFRDVPYAERRRMLAEFLPHLPEGYHAVEQVEGPSAALDLWRRVTSGRHGHTREGLVAHPETGRPSKLKTDVERDVHVAGTYPGKGRRAATVGGIEYAHEPGGRVVGRVGSGFSAETLRQLAADPEGFRGRIARIRAQERLPSGAYRAPRFLAWHEG